MHRRMSPRDSLIAGAALVGTGIISMIVLTLLSGHLFAYGLAPTGAGLVFLIRGAIGVARVRT